MKNQFSYLNNLINDLNRTSKYLTEDYIFNEGGDEMPQEGPAMGDGMGSDFPQDSMQDSHPQMQQGGDDNAEQKAMHAHEVIQHEPIIQKIRQTAIDGLKKYAEDPTSSIYEFFKKVFLESDKVLTDDGSSSK